MTPLHLAVQTDKRNLVSILLASSAAIDAPDGKGGRTPLYVAAENNLLKVAELLLMKGARAQCANYAGGLPIQTASARTHQEMVKLLMKYGGGTEQSPEGKMAVPRTVVACLLQKESSQVRLLTLLCTVCSEPGFVSSLWQHKCPVHSCTLYHCPVHFCTLHHCLVHSITLHHCPVHSWTPHHCSVHSWTLTSLLGTFLDSTSLPDNPMVSISVSYSWLT